MYSISIILTFLMKVYQQPKIVSSQVRKQIDLATAFYLSKENSRYSLLFKTLLFHFILHFQTNSIKNQEFISIYTFIYYEMKIKIKYQVFYFYITRYYQIPIYQKFISKTFLRFFGNKSSPSHTFSIWAILTTNQKYDKHFSILTVFLPSK